MHVLGIIGKSVIALAALGGVIYFAKRQMGRWPWQNEPDAPVTRGGTGTGGPSQPPK
jgi:hypothetical protein